MSQVEEYAGSSFSKTAGIEVETSASGGYGSFSAKVSTRLSAEMSESFSHMLTGERV